MKKLENNRQSGITLIALVITIIVLIILAGVAINLTLGQNGLLNRTKEAREKYEIASAKEYIELKIDECIIEKGGDASLQDIIDYLAEDSSVTYYVALEEVGLVAGEVDIGSPKEIYVVYNSYQFKVDESKNVEFISIVDVDLEGKVSIEAQVKEYLGKNAEEKYEASVLLKATGDAEISKLEIENPDGTTLTLEPDGLTTVGRDMTIEFDKTYKVILTTANGHRYTKKIIEKSEETIMNAEQLASFRDKVNSGLTYEGKTVRLGADIDLSTVCGENVGGKEISWEPIGTKTIAFKGNFEGNYKTINNLYIKNFLGVAIGLFAFNKGTIEKIIFNNIYIYEDLTSSTVAMTINGPNIGGVVASNSGTINQCEIRSGIITNINTTKSNLLYRCMVVGGIVGTNSGVISQCINKANVYVKNTTEYSSSSYPHNMVGGIVGTCGSGSLENCYNSGKIEGYNSANNLVGGLLGRTYAMTVTNSYNRGQIIGTCSYSSNNNKVRGLVGENFYTSGELTLKNTYCVNNVSYSYNRIDNSYTTGIVSETTLKGYASTLGDAYTNDIQNEDGTWKYNKRLSNFKMATTRKSSNRIRRTMQKTSNNVDIL